MKKQKPEPKSPRVANQAELDTREMDEADLVQVSGGIIVIGGITSDPYPDDLNPQPLPPRQLANGQS